jgi:4-hydroxy-tetrahydrodipicolinate reductase
LKIGILMKIAIIGSGKTGSEVVKLLPENQISGIYNSSNKVTKDQLKNADVAIIFVSGSAVPEILHIVMSSGIPAVWGSTGFKWSDNLNEQLKKQGTKWVIATNFSLGMNLIRHCMRVLAKGNQFLESPHFAIHEIHHKQKKDAPSGTALSWRKWLNVDCDIYSQRKDDIKGIHELVLNTDDESISLKHEVHNRALFAKGALWAANYLVNHPRLENGLYTFSEIVDQSFKELEL